MATRLASNEISDLDPYKFMAVIGKRAMTAASLLARLDHPDLTVAVGGPDDWAAARHRPLETSR